MGNRRKLISTSFLSLKNLFGELDVVGSFGEAPCQIKATCVKSTNTLEVLT